MLVSRKWLENYVQLPDHDELVDRLTMSGLNHEGSEPVGDDQQIDLEVTSNRSDCLGHIGVAREIAVLFENSLKIPDPQPKAEGPPISEEFDVEIRCPDLCYRFTARLIRGARIGPSPDWLVQRLEAVGVASVNNVVDISNFVMLECGQPLHAFDYDKLQGGKIVVREPESGEKLVAIDHHTYDLQPGMCVIADGTTAVGLGGVMGGADTEVSESTTNILVEAAFFNPMAVRSTARKLKLHSAASYRFERSINSENIDWASRRCCELIVELAGGELARDMIDAGNPPEPRQPIRLRFAQLDRILGIQIPRDRTVSILEDLGFAQCVTRSIDGQAGGVSVNINVAGFSDSQKDELVGDTDDEIQVIPPPWRLDCTREVDLIEEVGRIYGYDKVPDDIHVPMAASVRSHDSRVVDKIRHAMTAAGFDEAMTASLVPQAWSDCFSPWCDHPPLQSHQPMLGVLDTSWQNMPVNLLRRSLVPSLLEAFRVNEYKQNEDVDLFELAKVYLPTGDGLPAEPWKLAVISQRDFLEVKGVIASMVDMLNPQSVVETRPCNLQMMDITYSGELWLGEKRLGWLGQASAEAMDQFRFKRNATIAELDVSVLTEAATSVAIHSAISPFPAISRDFNFVVDESVSWDALSATVRSAGGDLLESIRYRETFRDADKDGENKKRVLLTIVLRSVESTLTGEQAEKTCQDIIDHCNRDHGATLLG